MPFVHVHDKWHKPVIGVYSGMQVYGQKTWFSMLKSILSLVQLLLWQMKDQELSTPLKQFCCLDQFRCIEILFDFHRNIQISFTPRFTGTLGDKIIAFTILWNISLPGIRSDELKMWYHIPWYLLSSDSDKNLHGNYVSF